MEGDKKKPDTLMDLMGKLQKDIQDSDWLKHNTAEKWSKDNPELSEQYMRALNKSNQDLDSETDKVESDKKPDNDK